MYAMYLEDVPIVDLKKNSTVHGHLSEKGLLK